MKDLILEQVRINENISKKFAINDKVLENINTKMDSFSSTIKDKLSYNKKIESQLTQLATALSFATNLEKVNTITIRGDKSTRDHHIRQGQARHQWQCRKRRKQPMKLKNLDHKIENYNKIFKTQLSYRFHAEIRKSKWMSSLVSS